MLNRLRSVAVAGARAGQLRRRDVRAATLRVPARVVVADESAMRVMGPALPWGALWSQRHLIRQLASTNPTSTSFTRFRAPNSSMAAPLRPEAWRSLEQLSPLLVCAIVHAEDPTFFEHRGFWWAEIKRQIDRARMTRAPVRGVSTITQQLARNLYLRPGRTIKRKTQEAIITRWLEDSLPKRRILELYANVVEWGPNVWGAEAAARTYFAISAANLGAFGAVFLASVLPAPRASFNGTNGRRVIRAQRRLTALLYGSGIISRTQECETYSCINKLEQFVGDDIGLRAWLLNCGQADTSGCRHTIDDLLTSHCEFRCRYEYESFVFSQCLYTRGAPSWPEWWSSTAAHQMLA